MVPEKELILFRLRAFLVGTLILAILVLLWVLVSTRPTNALQISTSESANLGYGMFESPNIVTRDMSIVSGAIDRSVNSASVAVSSIFQPVTLPKLHINEFATGVATGTSRAVSQAFSSTTHAVVGSALFVIRAPGKMVGFVTGTAINSIVKPAEHDAVPVIDPNSPELAAAQATFPASVPASLPNAPTAAVVPQWPLHGRITTQFGEPEPPYQPIHTGVDISDGHRAGVSPIHPFRPGRVIEAFHSRIHLGNEVVIDHGSGVTSVYGHLNSFTVQVGQNVDENTILGYEGTTGVSTGPHLHFEIRINGQVVDPHKFISGQP